MPDETETEFGEKNLWLQAPEGQTQVYPSGEASLQSFRTKDQPRGQISLSLKK